MGQIIQAIDAQIVRPRAMQAFEKGCEMTREDIESFYSQGSPVRYQRTYQYHESPMFIMNAGGNCEYHYTIKLNPPSYSTGTYSGEKVLEEAQYNGSGILGKPNTWHESEQDIIQAVESAFGG
nr:MAG TPA: hypothetical protein [Caudoviricetes sp.]